MKRYPIARLFIKVLKEEPNNLLPDSEFSSILSLFHLYNSISDCDFGVYVGGIFLPFPYAMEIRDNQIMRIDEGIRVFSFSSTLEITGNVIDDLTYMGIWVGSWGVIGESDPEWGENPPVNIIGNELILQHIDAGGITAGSSVQGVSNALVQDNVFSKNTLGIIKEWMVDHTPGAVFQLAAGTLSSNKGSSLPWTERRLSYVRKSSI